MRPEKASDSDSTIVHRHVSAQNSIVIENLTDLNPQTDAILKALNADKRLLLLAAVDPAGVLKDLGYELSPQAARELRHSLPKMSREQRDRYLNWLRELGDDPDIIDIRLVKQTSGGGLLEKSGGARQRAETTNALPGKSTGGFDIVAQFGETFCDRMLKRNYAFGYLPRSVYRVDNNLEYFYSSGEFNGLDSSQRTADREIHFHQPTLTFPMSQADAARVTSAFVAEGFGTEEIQGAVAVDADLSVRKDSKGQPEYVELSFDSLTAADVTVKITAGSPTAAASAELTKMVMDAYKGFSKSASVQPGIPLTFQLVDSTALAGKGTLAQLSIAAGIRKPAGATEPILVLGADRSSSGATGDLDAVPCAMKPGADFAMVQDFGWLTKDLNEAVSASMPVYYDPDTGQVDSNGNLRIDSISWRYREGGLSGHVDATMEDVTPEMDVSLNDFEIHMDISFHSSEPTVEWVGSSGLPDLPCWAKFLFVLGFAIIGAIVGWLLGFAIGAGLGAAALGEMIGYGIGTVGGLLTGYALVGWEIMSFDTSGIQFNNSSSGIQSLKITHARELPETGGSVTVAPNDYQVGEQGTLMSAEVIGPNYTEPKPSVMIQGTFSAEFTPPATTASSGSAQAAAPARNTGTGISIAGLGKGNAITRGRFGEYVAGTVTLDYLVASTSGLQGKLAYLWSFNGTPIGTESSVDLELPVTADMVQGFEYNKANILGVISVTVTDSFGRTGTASETITIGNARDLRSFVPAIMEEREYVDPIERAGLREYGDPVSYVGWQMEGDPVAGQMGALKSLSTITIGGKNYAIVGTQKI